MATGPFIAINGDEILTQPIPTLYREREPVEESVKPQPNVFGDINERTPLMIASNEHNLSAEYSASQPVDVKGNSAIVSPNTVLEPNFNDRISADASTGGHNVTLGEFVSGRLNPVPCSKSLQGYNPRSDENQHVAEDRAWTKRKGCCRFFQQCLYFALMFGLAGLFILFTIFLYIIPKRNQATTQSILNGDIILLPLNPNGLPSSLYTMKLTVGVSKHTSPITVLYTNSCVPRNTNTEFLNSDSIVIGPGFIVDVIVKYVASGSTVSINFTLSNLEWTSGTKTAILCIVDNKSTYDQFKENSGDPNTCRDLEKYTYYVPSGSIHKSLNLSFSNSQYLFIFFLSASQLNVKYSYNFTYYYYNQNVTSLSNCTISDKTNWQSCSFNPNEPSGCYLAYSAPSSETPMFTDITETLLYTPHIVLVCVFTALSAVIIVLTIGIYACFKCKYKL